MLSLELCHSCSTCTAGTLVGSYSYATDMGNLLKGSKGNDHLNSGAVRVCNNAAWSVECILGIYLRYYKRHIVIHTIAA